MNPVHKEQPAALPDHLVTPAIDEEALMRVRAKEKSQKNNALKTDGRKKKIPIQVKKGEQLQQKLK